MCIRPSCQTYTFATSITVTKRSILADIKLHFPVCSSLRISTSRSEEDADKGWAVCDWEQLAEPSSDLGLHVHELILSSRLPESNDEL